MTVVHVGTNLPNGKPNYDYRAKVELDPALNANKNASVEPDDPMSKIELY